MLRQYEAFEARKKQLEQRVKLIEDLRRDQAKAVHLLDKVSTSVPDRLWLTDMKQTGDSIQMDGQTSTLTALADFIGNLENTGYFKRPVEIISSTEEKINAMDLIKFQMKADFVMPGSEAGGAGGSRRAGASGSAPVGRRKGQRRWTWVSTRCRGTARSCSSWCSRPAASTATTTSTPMA